MLGSLEVQTSWNAYLQRRGSRPSGEEEADLEGEQLDNVFPHTQLLSAAEFETFISEMLEGTHSGEFGDPIRKIKRRSSSRKEDDDNPEREAEEHNGTEKKKRTSKRAVKANVDTEYVYG
ncbi:hypothetical protein BLNAU_22806 [Blattamonas nauphoetae]|uniref:Uncharacterized protein n=1 Tax=Blattamonas nauphoetae TaxID=2049346 RepID=A0ABQ9WT48_9EUKA|nr:hypothetical protein BLNAU_22806 [Blattamonas nauphoetae]